MRAEITGIFNGVTESSFKDDNGKDISYKSVTLLEDNSNYTLTCGVERNVDLSILNRFDTAIFICNIFNGRRPKIVGIKVDSINSKKTNKE